MTSRGVQELLLLVEEGIIELPFEFPYVPWTITRALGYVRMIKNAYQRAAYDPEPDRALAPKWFMLDSKRVDAWHKQRKESHARRDT